MPDEQLPQGLPDIPEALALPERKWLPSLIWLVPIVAALIGGGLAVKAVWESGPTITLRFNTAEGLEAGKTKIKYKNVDIGDVKTITLAEDRSSVIATAQMARQAAKLLVQDTRFWVVRPRVAASGVTGLTTLVSGSYIGVDVGKSADRRDDFVGLETPPTISADRPGRLFVLRGEDMGSLDVGSPVYFRRVQVGQVVGFELETDGFGVTLRIFVGSPYDRFVKLDTRFWQASGIDLTVDATGLKLNTESLVALAVGGIAFQTPEELLDSPEARAETHFTLHPTRAKALAHPDTLAENFVLNFKESLRGLSVGAPVDFRGVVIGEVTDIEVNLNPVNHDLTMPVSVRLYPERLLARNRRATDEQRRVEPHALFNRLVARGLRAQLRNGNLLTGQRYVALDFFPGKTPAKLAWDTDPVELPTIPGSLEGLQTTLTEIAGKLGKVPFDAIGNDLRQALQTLDRTLKRTEQLVTRVDTEIAPEARAAISDARKTLGAAERTLAADAPLQQDMRETLREVTRAAESLRTLLDYLERHPESLIRGKKGEP
jgi:paraquat-inducible protein B